MMERGRLTETDDMCRVDMLGLMILCSLLTGSSGDTYLSVFSSDGENVSLPCANALPDCTSTTWMYNRGRSSVTVKLSKEGMKNKDIERRERLSLGSDCSLNIYKATTEDHGRYTCRKQLNTPINNDDNVFLHVLHVSPSSTQTEIRPGRSFTLSCQLYVYDVYGCVDLFNNEGIKLVWKDKTGVDLQSDSRYQISFSPDHCTSSLTTTLLNEDDNTEWRCEITKGAEVETSARYTVTYLDTTPTPATPSTTQGSDKAAVSSLTPVTPVTPPAADVHENPEDVAYAEVIISRNKSTERHNAQADDRVTYAAIRGATAGGQDEDLKFC